MANGTKYVFRGDRLEKLRKNVRISNKPMTQEKLANELKALGIEKCRRELIKDYEIGNRNVPLETVFAIADFFGVSSDYLYGRTSVKSKSQSTIDICRQTGLSEKSLAILQYSADKKIEIELGSDKYQFGAYTIKLIDIINKVLESDFFLEVMLRSGDYIVGRLNEIYSEIIPELTPSPIDNTMHDFAIWRIEKCIREGITDSIEIFANEQIDYIQYLRDQARCK